MQITMITAGTRGDVQPYIALGLGLKAVGCEVTIATHASFEDFVRHYGLSFYPVGGDPPQLLRSEGGASLLQAGLHPLQYLRHLRVLASPFLDSLLTDLWQACEGSDIVIHSALGYAGYWLAEFLGKPSIGAYYQPLTRTHAFPIYPIPPNLRLGKYLNAKTYVLGEYLFWCFFGQLVDNWQKHQFPSRVVQRHHLQGQSGKPSHPIIYGFSPTVVPKPDDWGKSVEVTGYWFLDGPHDWQPPAALTGFLSEGPKPIYIGFGSMTSVDPISTTQLVIAALRQARQRAIIAIGWGGLANITSSKDVLVCDYSIPHDWIFPRVKAVVHHGGAGTSSAALRAGVPSVIVPFMWDQPFWGARVASLGAGTSPIPRNCLSVDRLAESIVAATSDGQIQRRAAEIGAKLRSEDGIGKAVEIILRYIQRNQR